MRTINPPEIIRGMPSQEYHALTGYVSKSMLEKLLPTPAHCREAMDHPSPSTADQILGTQIHSCLLTPDEFSTYVMATDCKAIKKTDGKECSNPGTIAIRTSRGIEFMCGVHGKGFSNDSSIPVISRGNMEICASILTQIAHHHEISELINGQESCTTVDHELSFSWRDGETGLACKGRADIINHDWGALADIKKTRDASKRRFSRDVFEFGYHRQGAFYLAGLAECGIGLEHFQLIAVEDFPPFEMRIFELSQMALEIGWTQIQGMLKTWKQCIESDIWPGYAPEIEIIEPSKWDLEHHMAIQVT